MPGISVINSLPSVATPEEYRELTSSTPASFADLPVIIYHQERNVSIILDPNLDGFSAEDCSKGTVYILSTVLIFMSASGKGIQITYPTISLHAISRADLGPSIYCQLDEMVELDHEPTQDEEDAMEMRELRINVPETSLEPMFEALSQCAALHPDENEDEDEDDFDEAFLDTDEGNVNQSNGTEQEELSEAGRATLAHLESIITDPHGHLAEDPSDEEDPNLNQNDSARILQNGA